MFLLLCAGTFYAQRKLLSIDMDSIFLSDYNAAETRQPRYFYRSIRCLASFANELTGDGNEQTKIVGTTSALRQNSGTSIVVCCGRPGPIDAYSQIEPKPGNAGIARTADRKVL
jgi:hypothetical protein